MAFLLTLLGTNTKYEPTWERNGLPGNETLSFISSHVGRASIEDSITPVNELLSDDYASYRAPGVTVIDGPKTDGSNVYEKIASGVYELLTAIQGGEFQLNLIGHSRGAVECIVVSHELQRIQDTIKLHEGQLSEEQLLEIFCNSPCVKTKDNLQRLLSLKPIPIDSFEQRFKCEGAIRLSIFALDPVPGVEHETAFSGLRIWWKDSRHYQVPSIVKDYRQIIMQDETSIGFRGIVPMAQDPSVTQYKLLNMPGHHGTASGNPFDQLEQDSFISTADKTRDCQIITMAQVYDHLERNGIIFKSREGESFLSEYYNLYKAGNFIARRQFKCLHYRNMNENLKFYAEFRNTYYTGQEDQKDRLIAKIFDYKVDDDRKLYKHNKLDEATRLRSIISYGQAGYINEEHTMLEYGLTLNFQDEPQNPEIYLEEFIASRRSNITNISRAARSDSPILTDISNGVISLIKALTETYLINGLHTERKNKILAVLSSLKDLQHKEPDLYSSISTQMRQWIDAQVKSHFDDLSDLVFELDVISEGDVYAIAYNKYEQFLSAATNLQEIVDVVFDKSLPIKAVFDKQVKKFRFYAKGVERFCAEAMLRLELDIPALNSDDSPDKLKFAKNISSLLSGLSGRLAENNDSLLKKISELETTLELEKGLEQNSTDINNECKRLEEQANILEQQNRNILNQLELKIAENNRLQEQLEAQKLQVSQLPTDTSKVNACNKHIQRAPKPNPNNFSGISLQIIGGFAAVVGIAAVSVALVFWLEKVELLTHAVEIGIGVCGTALTAYGFYNFRVGVKRESLDSKLPTICMNN